MSLPPVTVQHAIRPYHYWSFTNQCSLLTVPIQDPLPPDSPDWEQGDIVRGRIPATSLTVHSTRSPCVQLYLGPPVFLACTNLLAKLIVQSALFTAQPRSKVVTANWLLLFLNTHSPAAASSAKHPSPHLFLAAVAGNQVRKIPSEWPPAEGHIAVSSCRGAL